ncbi:right-handed parallel beta-helix repeat-containing protein [Methanobacterium paludis]|uniref:right-handed parallel beta-helix repeat-containing protein n=1 Tax=Methanobacterium paludis (strain DSM 25820 / JCM 18151 / SWAN1) TaxID=868131 RepID=UPI000A01E7EF|nr:right-handed parallel beta-helix repeat-containing protein [Methanobacterium paludis]
MSASGDFAAISGNNITSNVDNGITINGADAIVSENTVTNNGLAGIVINGASATITGNTAAGNGDNGISVTGDYATINGNILTYNKGTGILVNGNYATVTGNNVSYNCGGQVIVNGSNATVFGNTDDHNNLLNPGSLYSYLVSLGIPLVVTDVDITMDSIAAALTGEQIGEIAGIVALDNLVGLVVAFVIADALLTAKYPDIMVPANLKALPQIGILFTLYDTKSEIRGDGNPLTPQRLQGDLQGVLSLLTSKLYNYDDYKDEVNNSNKTDEEKQNELNIGFQFFLNCLSGGGGDDNTKYIPLGAAFTAGATLISEGIEYGDREAVIAGGRLLGGAIAVVSSVL